VEFAVFAVAEPIELSGCAFLRSVAIDGDRLQPQLPRLDVGFHDLFDGGVLRHVDGLGNCAGDERLRRRHHAQMSHVVDGARAFGRLEGAIEDGEVLVFDVRRAFDGAGRVDVADDGVGLVVRCSPA
jgi:hypothetical protein